MTLLEKAKLDGHYIVLDNEGREFVPECPHILGYEPRSETILFCAGHRCHECWSREYKGDPEEAETPTNPGTPTDPVKSTTRESILKEAITCTCTDRNLQYGGPETTFPAIAELWTGYLRANGHDITLTAKDTALMLMLFKTARAITSETPKADTYIDMAGYAACAGEIACK